MCSGTAGQSGIACGDRHSQMPADDPEAPEQSRPAFPVHATPRTVGRHRSVFPLQPPFGSAVPRPAGEPPRPRCVAGRPSETLPPPAEDRHWAARRGQCAPSHNEGQAGQQTIAILDVKHSERFVRNPRQLNPADPIREPDQREPLAVLCSDVYAVSSRPGARIFVCYQLQCRAFQPR